MKDTVYTIEWYQFKELKRTWVIVVFFVYIRKKDARREKKIKGKKKRFLIRTRNAGSNLERADRDSYDLGDIRSRYVVRADRVDSDPSIAIGSIARL